MKVLTFTLLSLLAVTVTFADRDDELPGHLVTLSSHIWSGELFKYCLTLPEGGDLMSGPAQELSVRVTLNNSDTNTTTNYPPKVYFQVTGVSKCDKLRAPDESGWYNLNVTLGAMLGTTMVEKTYSTNIQILDSSTQQLTLIQTDKPLYKPGQTVKFRVMKLKKDFRPVFGKIPFVSIENPSGVRVMQWKNVDLSKGIASLEMPLSKEPPLGMWKIRVMFDKDVTQDFEVKEYVLPKFEVTVTPPSYLLPTTRTIEGEVCGKYTYGKPVRGVVELKVCFQRNYWWGYMRRDNYEFERPCSNHILRINGCAKFSVNSSELYLNSARYRRYGQLTVNATITEDGTGIVLQGYSKGPEMTFYPFELRMEDDTNNYFKSVFPYTGRVTATRPDGTPASDELIEVSVEDFNWGSPWALRKVFTTDNSGKITFSIENVPENVTGFSVQARAIQYTSDYWSRDVLQLYQPQSNLYVRRWTSPSDSFIQIEDIPEPVKCGQDLKLSVLYSTPPNTNYKMHVLVTSGSEILYTNHHSHHFKIHNAVDFQKVDKSNYLERYTPTPPPPIEPLRPVPTVVESNSTTSKNDTEPEPVHEDLIVPEVVEPLFDPILNRRRRQAGGCVDAKDNPVKVGDQYKPDANQPCKTCICSDSNTEEETCFTAMCVPPPCPRYKLRPQECCAWDCLDEEGNVIPPDMPIIPEPATPPSPRDCADSDGNAVKHGDHYTPSKTNPCRQCLCDDGSSTGCEMMMCSPPPCENFITIPGTCCGFRCPGDTGAGCIDKDGSLIAEGEPFFPNRSNVCQNCMCNKGQPENCAMIMCDEPQCPYYELIPNTCCGFRCLDSPPPPPSEKHVARMHLTIPISAVMAPKAKVIVYYVRDDMETVASSREFQVEKCFDNKVNLEFLEKSVSPGSEATIKLQAEPGSVCSVGVVDKSMKLLKPDHQVTPEKFYKLIESIQPYVPSVYYGWSEIQDYCKEQLKEEVEELLLKDNTTYYSFSTETADSMEAFNSASLITLSNLKVRTRACKLRTYLHRRRYRPMPMFSVGSESGLPGNGRTDVAFDSVKSVNVDIDSQKKVRSFFPETWLWDIEVVGDTGEIVLKRDIPDTITEWVGNSVCASASAGVGISQPAAITAFQPFFLSFTLPYSAVRGEIVPVLVTVFNYMTECLTMQVDLLPSTDFALRNKLSATKYDCVCGGDSSTFKFDVSPTTLGKIQIEASAQAIPDNGICENNAILSVQGVGSQDAVRRELLIEAEGIEKEYTFSSYECPSVTTGTKKVTTIDLPIPDDTVPGSARGFVSVIGDVMGPALSNLQDLLRMPYGCGEQNMASFSPNIFALQYLYNTNQETQAMVEEAKKYMRVGYQRQLRYRHPDGSYSAWGGGEGTSGSTWLTAFVVKCLGQSRPYIDIDDGDLNLSIQWFKRRQSETGCFPKIGYTHSYYLKGGYSDRSNEAVMTSFVLIAMMEAGLSKDDQAILDGIRCLDIQTVEDTYTMAIMAYAYSLFDVNHPRRQEIMTMLTDKAIVDGETVHWERQDDDGNVTQSPYYWYRAPSAEIEITSYALLASIVGNQPTATTVARPIVLWLSKQRNSLGGFSSTQDTIVALQALSKYATLVYQGGIDLTVGVTGTNFSAAFGISDENNLLLQSKMVDTIPNTLTTTVSGVGCALVQANVKYNVPDETAGPAFRLKTGIFRSKTEKSNCAKRTINICVSFTGEGGVSNMAIVDVKMQTGWIPVKDTLKQLLQFGGVGSDIGLQKYETDGNMVHLYFDQLDRVMRCFYFDLEQTIEVRDPKPAFIKVYDYYETDFNVIQQYDIRTICGTKEELPFITPEEYASGIMNAPNGVITQVRVPFEALPGPGLPLTCPKCLDSLPATEDELESLICGAQNIYKLRTGSEDNMKLYADMKPLKKLRIGKFVKRVMSDSCVCSMMQVSGSDSWEKNKKLLVISEGKAVYDVNNSKLVLDDRSTLVKLSKDIERTVFRRNKGYDSWEKNKKLLVISEGKAVYDVNNSKLVLDDRSTLVKLSKDIERTVFRRNKGSDSWEKNKKLLVISEGKAVYDVNNSKLVLDDRSTLVKLSKDIERTVFRRNKGC